MDILKIERLIVTPFILNIKIKKGRKIKRKALLNINMVITVADRLNLAGRYTDGTIDYMCTAVTLEKSTLVNTNCTADSFILPREIFEK